jgi:hypothetical protein
MGLQTLAHRPVSSLPPVSVNKISWNSAIFVQVCNVYPCFSATNGRMEYFFNEKCWPCLRTHELLITQFFLLGKDERLHVWSTGGREALGTRAPLYSGGVALKAWTEAGRWAQDRHGHEKIAWDTRWTADMSRQGWALTNPRWWGGLKLCEELEEPEAPFSDICSVMTDPNITPTLLP